MSNRLDAAANDYAHSSAWSREVGLDVKYSPSSNVVVDLTLNTDFAQVEADDQQVNLTRFSLFFPERRLFFQERAELFDFSMGDSDRLFHSRRMGLVDGMPVRIYGGVRATGRVGAWDIGLIDLQTAGLDDAGSENAGVLRLRRRVLNPNSYAGTIFTSRIEADGGRSFAGGGDALLSLGTRNYLSLAIASSLLPDDSLDFVERSFARVRWERRGNYGLRLDTELAHVGGGFDPTLGFLARRDHFRVAGRTWWGWRMPEGSSLLRQSVSVGGAAFRRYSDRAVESAELSPQWYVETVSGHNLTFAAAVRHEDLTSSFSIAPDLSVPAGVYRFGAARVSYSPAQTGLLRFSGNAEVGRFFDGTLLSAAVSPTWNLNRHLQLSGTWQVNQITFPARDQERVAQVARIRSLLMLNSQLSGVALLQYNSASDALLINLRARYNPREGNDLYIVYNHGLNTDRFGFELVRPLTDNRTLLLKYSHTLRMQR